MKQKINFSVEVDVEDATGNVIAVYFRIRTGRVRETVEFADGSAFADYDTHGRLLGIELIGPCSVSVVDRIAKKESTELRRQTKKFMKNVGPPQFLAV